MARRRRPEPPVSEAALPGGLRRENVTVESFVSWDEQSLLEYGVGIRLNLWWRKLWSWRRWQTWSRVGQRAGLRRVQAVRAWVVSTVQQPCRECRAHDPYGSPDRRFPFEGIVTWDHILEFAGDKPIEIATQWETHPDWQRPYGTSATSDDLGPRPTAARIAGRSSPPPGNPARRPARQAGHPRAGPAGHACPPWGRLRSP